MTFAIIIIFGYTIIGWQTMKFRLNSVEILKKWRVRKQLFQIDTKLYVEAYQSDSKGSIATLIIMGYEEEIEQPLQKIIKKCNKKAKEVNYNRLIIPSSIEVEVVGSSKMFIFELAEKPISLHSLLTQCKYQFSVRQVMEAAISGISCLAELHSMGITHRRINLRTCYFYNRLQNVPLRKTNKTELVTWFGLNIIDSAKYEPKNIPKTYAEDILYEPISNALNIRYNYKSDLESLLFVLIRMGTGQLIFSQARLQHEWVIQENVKKWKIKDFFSQICELIPQNLSFLVEIYLCIQEMNLNDQPQYETLLKKLWNWKSTNATKQSEHLPLIENNKQQSFLHIADSSQLILQEDIELSVRQAKSGLHKRSL